MRDPGTAKERSFGLSVGAVLALVAIYFLWRGRAVAGIVAGVTALLLVVPAFVAPSILKVPSALWWRLAHLLGWFNSLVLLSATFAFVLTPLGTLFRLFGWDPLTRRPRAGASGWVPYPERQRDPRHYDRMY